MGAILAVALLGAGCGSQDPSGPQLPLWRQAPDKPAGPAPPRVAGTAEHFAVRTVARGLRAPVQVVARPGEPGRLYVAEQAGTVRIVEDGRVRERPWLDLRDRIRAGGELGLLSLAFSADGRQAAVLFTDRRMDSHVVTIERGRERELLFVDQPEDYENHKGGTVLYDERGRLVVGLGDGGSAFDPGQRAQDGAQRLGKILRTDPADPGGRWETVALGLRNPFRMAFDRATGRLWLGDVGQDRVEEVDALWLPEQGTRVPNLGWAAYEGHLPLGRKRLSDEGELTWPVASYAHGRAGHCSVTGGAVYRGRALAALRGRYVFGDFCRGTLWSMAAEGAPDLRREAARLPGVSSFGEDLNGELYATSLDGRVIRLANPDATDRDKY